MPEEQEILVSLDQDQLFDAIFEYIAKRPELYRKLSGRDPRIYIGHAKSDGYHAWVKPQKP